MKQLEREADHPSRSNEHVRISGLTFTPSKNLLSVVLR